MVAIALTDQQLDAAGWDYGAPLADVKRLAKVWETSYDWRKHEAHLNTLPNYHRQIGVEGFGELDIHYLYQPSRSADAVPLLFCELGRAALASGAY